MSNNSSSHLFNQLGDAIEQRWLAANYNEQEFPAIARGALEEFALPSKTNPWEALEWALSVRELPRRVDRRPGVNGKQLSDEYANPPRRTLHAESSAHTSRHGRRVPLPGQQRRGDAVGDALGRIHQCPEGVASPSPVCAPSPSRREVPGVRCDASDKTMTPGLPRSDRANPTHLSTPSGTRSR